MTAFADVVAAVAIPGFTFDVVEDRAVTVAMDCPTSPTGRLAASPRQYAEHVTDDFVVLDLIATACALAVHEVEEQARVNGQQFRSPHPKALFRLSATPTPAATYHW